MISRILSTSFHSVLSRIFITATNLFIVFFISKNFEIADLGTYGILFFFYVFSATFSSMNLYLFFGKEVARYDEKNLEDSLLFNELIVLALSGIIISFVLPVFVSVFYKKISLSMLLLSSFTGYFLGIERNLGGVLLGKEKMQLESLSNFVLFFLVLSPMTIWGDFFSTIGKIFVLRIIGYCIGIVIKLWFLRGHFLRVKLKLKLKMFMETKYYWFTGLSETALREADILILSFFIDGALLGAYFLALRIYFSFGILAEVISTSLTPFLSKCYVNKKSGGFYRFNKYMLFLFMVFSFIFSATLFFSRNLIVKLFSPEFLHYSGKYLFFLSFILFFRFFSFSTGIILSSSDLQRTRSNIMFSASILIIVLNVILGYYFNVSGVIISRAFIELLIFFLFGFFVNKIALKHDQDRQE